VESFVCGRLVLTKCLPCHISSETGAASDLVLESCLCVNLVLILPSAVTLDDCKSTVIVQKGV